MEIGDNLAWVLMIVAIMGFGALNVMNSEDDKEEVKVEHHYEVNGSDTTLVRTDTTTYNAESK